MAGSDSRASSAGRHPRSRRHAVRVRYRDESIRVVRAIAALAVAERVDPKVNVALVIALGVFGLMIGSFLNVCISRLPRGQSIVRPASHCLSCGTPIKWYDNIPVVSYLILHGRCRACRAPYTARYLFVELLTGAAF